jgi:hypothetical protein
MVGKIVTPDTSTDILFDSYTGAELKIFGKRRLELASGKGRDKVLPSFAAEQRHGFSFVNSD